MEKEETIVGEELMSSNIHPRLVTLAFMSPKNSYIENNSIKGTMKISETKPKFEGDYKEICTASWELNAKDPCPIVYKNMMYDIAMAEAFSDKEIMDRAKSMKEYKDLVDQKANEIFKGGTGISPGGGGDSEVRMSTNSNCKIIFRDEDGNKISKDEYKNRIAKKCLPNILFEQSLAHEEKHVDQCNKHKQEFILGGIKNTHIRGAMEVGAYLRGIKKLFYWLKENCEEHDLADVKVRIKDIEKLPINPYK